jgi:hypothetical protein
MIDSAVVMGPRFRGDDNRGIADDSLLLVAYALTSWRWKAT